MTRSNLMRWLLLTMGAALVMVTFSPVPAVAQDKLIWMGCGISKKAYMGEMARAYEEKTGVGFRMAGGGATKGIRLTASGKSDVGGSCRYIMLTPSGQPSASENVDMVHVAWDALAVVVNRNNPVENISLGQLRDIFSGRIANWRALGGDNRPIRLLVRNGRVSGVGRLFRQLVMGDETFEFPETAAFFASSGPLERNLEKRRSLSNGIAITGISSAKKTDLKVLKVNGYPPTPENIASGAYPLFRPLYLAVSKQRDDQARAFIDFVLGDEGQDIIAGEGTVNLVQGRPLENLWKNKGFPL